MRTAARLILTLALLLAAVLPVTAQELKPKRVGVILPGGPFYAGVEGLRAGLKAAGLEEGRQLSLRDTKGDLKAAERHANRVKHQFGIRLAARRRRARSRVVTGPEADHQFGTAPAFLIRTIRSSPRTSQALCYILVSMKVGR